MTIITQSNNYVKVDMSALVLANVKTPFKIAYIMKDQTLLVSLDNNEQYVSVVMSNNIFFKLDVNGVNGSPATINGITPSSNEQLAEQLANLRNL